MKFNSKFNQKSDLKLSVAMALAVLSVLSGCNHTSNQKPLLPQESDPIFRQSKRHEILVSGFYFIHYHFPSESVESLATRLKGSQLFKLEPWNSFERAEKGGGMYSERKGWLTDPQNIDSARFIVIMPGAYGDDLNKPKALEGATVILMPASNWRPDERKSLDRTATSSPP
jgi:hypothetical protein